MRLSGHAVGLTRQISQKKTNPGSSQNNSPACNLSQIGGAPGQGSTGTGAISRSDCSGSLWDRSGHQLNASGLARQGHKRSCRGSEKAIFSITLGPGRTLNIKSTGVADGCWFPHSIALTRQKLAPICSWCWLLK